MKKYGRRGWDFGDFEITKREILASVSIIAIMLLIGVIISGKISESQLDANEKYNKATKIDTLDLFEYGMRTNIGNAFVYGTLEAVDTVTYPEIDGVYMYVEKVKEKYTKHTRTVSDYDEDGNKIGEHEEEYWNSIITLPNTFHYFTKYATEILSFPPLLLALLISLSTFSSIVKFSSKRVFSICSSRSIVVSPSEQRRIESISILQSNISISIGSFIPKAFIKIFFLG